MPTRAGTLVVIGSLVLLLAGRVLGMPELIVLGTVGIVLVLAAIVTVRWRLPDITAHRTVHPARVHAGTASRVELSVVNSGRRRSPVLTIDDQVSGTGGAHLLVAPVAPAASASAAYRLPTERRGIITIGPLSLTRTDPFGLARQAVELGIRTELTVLPRLLKLLPLPYSLGDDPLAGAEQPNHLGRGGEDFYALRPYVVGDDLRRVHWPSTARSGDLLVRQDEQPWQGRVTVLLDVRRSVTDGPTFEEMVTAVASIITASRQRGDLVRLCTTAGFDSGFLSGHSQIDGLMEHLAVVSLDSAGSLSTALAAIARGTGSVVAVVGEAAQADLDALVSARARAGGLTLVQITPSSAAGPLASIAADRARRAHVRIVRVGAGERVDDVWNRVMARRGVGR